MAEYSRCVSYFYRYEHGGKQQNVGFGKVECQKQMLRLTIKLSDAKAQSAALAFYFYAFSGGQVQLIPVEKVQMQKGQLMVRKEYALSELFPDGTELNHCSGLIGFYSEGVCYGSQWDEERLPVAELLRAHRQQEEELEQTLAAAEQKELHDPVDAVGEQEEAAKADTGVHKEDNADASARQETNREDTENRKEEQEPEPEVSQQEYEEVQTGIAFLLSHRSPLPDFSGNEVMHCVKITPEDIGLTSRDNWDLGNNSFLMHGYYSYQYLLLGSMVYEDGKRQYVIGVPGIFSNKDQYLACLFGFKRFIPLKKEPYQTGSFGYWITRCKE